MAGGGACQRRGRAVRPVRHGREPGPWGKRAHDERAPGCVLAEHLGQQVSPDRFLLKPIVVGTRLHGKDTRRLVCPRCGNDGSPGSCRFKTYDEGLLRTDDAGFLFLEDIVAFRDVGDFDEAGRLTVDSNYHSGEGYDAGTGTRLECRCCGSEFSLPADLDGEFMA